MKNLKLILALLLVAVPAFGQLSKIDRATITIKNILKDPSFENLYVGEGGGDDWVNSGFTVTNQTNFKVGGNGIKLAATGSATFTSVARSMDAEWQGYQGTPGVATCLFSDVGTSTSNSVKIGAWNGSAYVGTPVTFTPSTTDSSTRVYQYFTFPSTAGTTIALRIERVGGTVNTYGDECFLGDAAVFPSIPSTPVSVSNGGTGLTSITSGNLTLGAGTSALTLLAPSTAGKTVTSDGSTFTSVFPVLVTGTSASPSLITAAGGIAFTGSRGDNLWYIAGNTVPVVVTATPQIAVGAWDGQKLTLRGENGTNTVTLADGNGLSLNGAWVGGLQSAINLQWDASGSVWAETSRR